MRREDEGNENEGEEEEQDAGVIETEEAEGDGGRAWYRDKMGGGNGRHDLGREGREGKGEKT
jgi:hypothetical protein